VETVHEEVKELLNVSLTLNGTFAVQAAGEVAKGGGFNDFDVLFPEGAYRVGVKSRHDTVEVFPVLLVELLVNAVF
jgi:hypothetical protein